MLQLGDDVRRPHVLFAPHAPGVFTTGIEHGRQHRVVAEGSLMHPNRLLGNFKHADALYPAGCSGEILLYGLAVEPDGLEQLRTAITHVGGDTHLGHDFRQPLAHRLDVVRDRLVHSKLPRQAAIQTCQCLERKVGVYGLGAITCQRGELVHLAGTARLHHQAGGGTQPLANQVLVYGAHRQQRRDRQLCCRNGTVADDQYVLATSDCIDCLGTQGCQLGLHTFMAPQQGVGDVQRVAAELAVGITPDIAQLGHIGHVKYGLGNLQAHRRIDLVDIQQIRFGADEGHQRHHDRFTYRINRRIGHLREQLLEVVVERFVLV